MKSVKTFVVLVALSGFSTLSMAQSEFFPLEKGQVHIYNYAEPFNSQASGQSSKTEILSTTKEINGKTYLVSQTSMGSNGDYTLISSSYLRNGKNGSVVGLESTSSKEELVMLPEGPLTKGQSWEMVTGGVSSTSTVIDLHGQVDTPAKRYSDCLVVEMKNAQGTIRSYSKKGIGMVALAIVINGEEKLMSYLVK